MDYILLLVEIKNAYKMTGCNNIQQGDDSIQPKGESSKALSQLGHDWMCSQLYIGGLQ